LHSLRYNRAMEQASGILQRIVDGAVAQSLKRLPPEELPQAAWEFVAGRTIAEKTRVIGCAEQILRISVVDVNWRAQLRDMAAQYLARLRPLLAIQRIEFELAGAAPKQEHYDKARSTAPPKPKEGLNGAPGARPTSAERPQMRATRSAPRPQPEKKEAHEGHRKGRNVRRRPGES